ncbi:MAG: hypothetical protein KBG73_08985 [Candidatus Promineofilum sp.]|jgi:hypothetical protein|nr:hypothetical protein [Promineifilum sp.]
MKSERAKERPKDKAEPDEQRVSTLKELLRDKPKRGRPRRMVARQNVYVALRPEQKGLMADLGQRLPDGLGRPDVPDLAVSVLTARLEALRTAVAGRTREIPEGVTDLESLYLLWDVVPPGQGALVSSQLSVGSGQPGASSGKLATGRKRPEAGAPGAGERWTSIRLSPQQALELGRAHGTLNAAFGAGRSEVFGLALGLLAQFLERHPLAGAEMGLSDVREMIFRSE